MNFLEFIKDAVNAGASDIHLASSNRAALRIDGTMQFFGTDPLSEEEVEAVIKLCVPSEKYEEYRKTGDMDCAAELDGCGRFRVNVFRQSKGPSMVLRTIKGEIPTMSDLLLPKSMDKILQLKEGIVLVTGPTGSGKSTTLAAIIDYYNTNRHCHIVTIEDPIEYVHKGKNCVVNQREIGEDSASYARALKAVLREDPDIILVGEMRDLESIGIALTAAETGHLVLSTLHTAGAAKTVDRMIDVFPHEQQAQIRTQLSMTLKSVLSQRLLPKASGKGRVAAFEILHVNAAVSNLIREGKTANINQVIQTGVAEGMITMERYVQELLQQHIIDNK